MIFTYSYWKNFCKQLREQGVVSIPARDLLYKVPDAPYLVLKHDVETNVSASLHMAQIESEYGHCGSYYVQAYLLDDPNNISILKQIQSMGHEIAYHYDVMDSNHGQIDAAILEFSNNCRKFEENGFHLETLCQHGNPVVERKGYTSNRDFFRSVRVRETFPNLTDVMVDFPQRICSASRYIYFSDAGRRFQLIYDPINNDVIPSQDKNIPFEDLNELMAFVQARGANAIISTHPHRWVRSKTGYRIKTFLFRTIRFVAKLLMKIPFIKRIMSRYYYLAKKI